MARGRRERKLKRRIGKLSLSKRSALHYPMRQSVSADSLPSYPVSDCSKVGKELHRAARYRKRHRQTRYSRKH